MKRWALALATVVALTLVLGMSVPVGAISIPVTNASFEAPVYTDGGFNGATGWTVVGTGTGGAWDPSTGQWGASPVPVPAGTQVGYANPSASLSQTLGATLQADQIYTMTVYVGTRATSTGSPVYEVALYAGTTKLASKKNVTDPITPGAFSLVTVTYTAPSSGDPLIGQTLSIQLANTGGTGPQPNFDVVTLDYVPLPPSVLLLGSGLLGLGLLGWRRKKS